MADRVIDLDCENLPDEAIFKGYQEYYVQELKIVKEVTCYRRARYRLPDGTYKLAALPAGIDGHFGNELKKYLVYQSHVNNVSQAKIRQELVDIGIQISEGEVSNIVLDAAAMLEKEYEDVGQTGIKYAKTLCVDDTGDRHCGKQGYCLVIQNKFFTYFRSSDNKSRKNFLNALRVGSRHYAFNDASLQYVEAYKPKVSFLQKLLLLHNTMYPDEHAWCEALKNAGINEQNMGVKMRKVLDEAVLLGGAIENGLDPKVVILSDGAPQFEILTHALCWIHAERAIKKLIPQNDAEVEEIKLLRNQLWGYYQKLQLYKDNPQSEDRILLDKLFDQIFSQSVLGQGLSNVLADFRRNKKDLLRVLEFPETPLHNNSSEQDIRGPVIKRKISGCTRTTNGRLARNIFTSLYRTCRKLNVSFWNYLDDRFGKTGKISYLPCLIKQKVFQGPPFL